MKKDKKRKKKRQRRRKGTHTFAKLDMSHSFSSPPFTSQVFKQKNLGASFFTLRTQAALRRSLDTPSPSYLRVPYFSHLDLDEKMGYLKPNPTIFEVLNVYWWKVGREQPYPAVFANLSLYTQTMEHQEPNPAIFVNFNPHICKMALLKSNPTMFTDLDSYRGKMESLKPNPIRRRFVQTFFRTKIFTTIYGFSEWEKKCKARTVSVHNPGCFIVLCKLEKY